MLSPTTTLHTAFPPNSTNEFPPPVDAGVGEVVGLAVADPDGDDFREPEAEIVELLLGLDADADPVPDAEVEAEDEEVSTAVDVVGVAEGVDVDFEGVVLELGLGLKLGLGLEPAATTTPPCALPAELEEEVPAAADL